MCGCAVLSVGVLCCNYDTHSILIVVIAHIFSIMRSPTLSRNSSRGRGEGGSHSKAIEKKIKPPAGAGAARTIYVLQGTQFLSNSARRVRPTWNSGAREKNSGSAIPVGCSGRRIEYTAIRREGRSDARLSSECWPMQWVTLTFGHRIIPFVCRLARREAGSRLSRRGDVRRRRPSVETPFSAKKKKRFSALPVEGSAMDLDFSADGSLTEDGGVTAFGESRKVLKKAMRNTMKLPLLGAVFAVNNFALS
ncbi:hypothetical protein EVAR_15053_1 [Eumeta japonica]|uniref:Uncharacterized protein n=1 Tax=Eumeta variegata TaxID=151549 RepID=A0A4C1YLD7_EUMVA|nr:hypothetical protein EVAR_15053_1 [Eumeta japonica]